jgi:hypothetical protein
VILGRAYREGAPVIWCPELMDMDATEAVRRVDIAVGTYNGKTATPTSSEAPTPPPGDPKGATAASTADPNAAAASTADQGDLFPSKMTPETASKTTTKTASKTAPFNPKEVISIKNEKPSCAASPPRRGGGDAAAGWRSTTRLPPASSAAHDLTVEIGKLCELPTKTWEWPEHWRRKAPNIVQQWLVDYGWERTEIICVVRHEAKKKKAHIKTDETDAAADWPPVSIRFFEKPIARLYASLARQRAELARNAKGA